MILAWKWKLIGISLPHSTERWNIKVYMHIGAYMYEYNKFVKLKQINYINSCMATIIEGCLIAIFTNPESWKVSYNQSTVNY